MPSYKPSFKYHATAKSVGRVPRHRHESRKLRYLSLSVPAKDIQFLIDKLGAIQWQAKNPSAKQTPLLVHNIGELRKLVQSLMKDREHAFATQNFWAMVGRTMEEEAQNVVFEAVKTMTPFRIKQLRKRLWNARYKQKRKLTTADVQGILGELGVSY